MELFGKSSRRCAKTASQQHLLQRNCRPVKRMPDSGKTSPQQSQISVIPTRVIAFLRGSRRPLESTFRPRCRGCRHVSKRRGREVSKAVSGLRQTVSPPRNRGTPQCQDRLILSGSLGYGSALVVFRWEFQLNQLVAFKAIDVGPAIRGSKDLVQDFLKLSGTLAR